MDDIPAPDNLPNVVKATPQGKWLTAGLAVFALVLVAFFLLYALPLLQAAIGLRPSSEARFAFKVILIGFVILIVSSAAVLMINGRSILRSGQCPPPDAWVARDTPVKRGLPARRIAWSYIAAGAASCLLAAAMLAYMWQALGRAAATPELKTGAITLLLPPAKKAPAVK